METVFWVVVGLLPEVAAPLYSRNLGQIAKNGKVETAKGASRSLLSVTAFAV